MINITCDNNTIYTNKIDKNKKKENSYVFHIGLDGKKILNEQIKNASNYNTGKLNDKLIQIIDNTLLYYFLDVKI
jgi:hypothetical protein